MQPAGAAQASPRGEPWECYEGYRHTSYVWEAAKRSSDEEAARAQGSNEAFQSCLRKVAGTNYRYEAVRRGKGPVD